MKFIEDYCLAYNNNSKLYDYDIKTLFNESSIYIMPMVNPDGVDLVTEFYQVNSPIYNSFKKISFKLTISCWLGYGKKNKIFTRF